jgi:hypothetical protein
LTDSYSTATKRRIGFDDLARHMAARDKRKLDAASADQVVAEAIAADRRMTRTRDLVLGLLLVVTGLAMCALSFRLNYDIFTFATGPARADEPNSVVYPVALTAIPIAMVIVGFQKTIRGLRAR